MKLVVISDIFGRTKAFEQLAADVLGNNVLGKLIDPYDEQVMNFANEKEAYQYFTQNVGLQR